jgi:hypothetical protein
MSHRRSEPEPGRGSTRINAPAPKNPPVGAIRCLIDRPTSRGGNDGQSARVSLRARRPPVRRRLPRCARGVTAAERPPVHRIASPAAVVAPAARWQARAVRMESKGRRADRADRCARTYQPAHPTAARPGGLESATTEPSMTTLDGRARAKTAARARRSGSAARCSA